MSTAVAGTCPACGSALVSERDAVPWCERCAWNIDVYEPPAQAGWFSRRIGAITHRIAYRLTMKQFRELASGTNWQGRELARGGSPFGSVPGAVLVGDLKPPRRWSLPRLVAIGSSLVIYAFLVYLAYLGVRLVRYNFPGPTLILGVPLLGVVLVLLPRLPRRPRHLEPLSRDRFPTLFAVVDRVSAGVGTKPPHTISVNPWFNAYTTAYGIRRRRHLTIGLALFGSLDPQQRVALLAHEMGHFGNGDIRRGLMVQPAMTTLGQISHLFGGSQIVSTRGWRGGGLAALLEPVVDLVMSIISSVFWLAHLGLLAVLLRDSQRREYLADQRAANLAGPRAAAQLMDLLDADLDSVVASRARAQQTQEGWREAAAELLAPQRAAKIHRLRQLSTRTDVSLWTTHPPAGLRAWLVEAHPTGSATIVLSEAESRQIDNELAGYYQRARRDLAQSGV